MSTIAGVVASRARISSPVFSHGPNDLPGRCGVLYNHHAILITTTTGLPLYSTVIGAPCVPGRVVEIPID